MPTLHRLSLRQVLLCGAAIVTLSMGIRHGFGLWMPPMTTANGWTRETFAFALATQNLVWGLAGPFAGMIADRFGAVRVLIAGALLYAGGLILMAYSNTGAAFLGSAGVMLGMAQAGTTYAVIFGVIGRNVAPERRTWAMGVVAAVGSFGQFLMVPVENGLINAFGWDVALIILGCSVLAIAPLALGLREPDMVSGVARPAQRIGEAIREAFGYGSFRLLTAGYFVCGFQVVFIAVHMPSYLTDKGLAAEVATASLALIGLFNVIGTFAAGSLGQRFPKRFLLSAIYALRAVVIVGFLLAPLTPLSVYIFSAAMGLLWLSTIPLTNGLVAQIFGVQYLSMLGGFVFLSHQVGSFLGAWMGGYLFDTTGDYTVVWWIAVALGVAAALINLPIREHAIARAQPA